MNNNTSNNSKFIITYQDNNMNIDISSYETLSNEDGIKLANIINKAYNDGYKTIIDCENLNVFSNNFYNSVENLSSLNFNINGQEISYDDIKAAIDDSLNSSVSSNYNYSYGGSGDDSVKLDYASIEYAIKNLSSVIDNSDIVNIRNAVNSLNPCYQELPSSSCVSTIKSNVNDCINTVSDIHNRLVKFRNYLREHDANYDYYANIQYIEGLEEFGEGLTEVEKYYVVNDIMKEIQGYKNVGSEDGMISSEAHQSVLDACNNYLDYYGYTGTEWILNKSTRTQEEQKFINRFYNNYSRKEQSELTDLQLSTLGIIAYDKADGVSEEYLSSHEDMVGNSFEEILAGRQAAIDSYTEEHAGYAVDDLSNAIFESGKKEIEDKYDECEVAYNKYLDYLEVANSSVETIYRRELATKLPEGIDVHNSDYYSKYLTSEQSDFLISRDLKHNDDKMNDLNTEVNELSNEFNELTNKKNLLATEISELSSMWCPTEDDYKEIERLQEQVNEIDKKLNNVSSQVASKKFLLDFIGNNSFNLYTKFSNFGELCNSNIADYKISTNFWENQVIDFYDKDGNKLDVSTEEGAIYIYTNQISFDKDIITDAYGNVIGEKNSYSRELKKMMNDVNQFKFDSVIDVDYFKVLNYLDNTANDMKFQYYYDRKYDDCLRIEGKLLADARTSVLDAHCSFVDFFSLTGWGLVDGVNQFIDGFVNLVSADGRPSAKQYMSMYMAEYINDNYSCDVIMQGAYEISTSIGNMLPSIAASFIPVVGPYLGKALMGLSAAGNARENGLQQGMTSAEAWVYGILSGASEVLLEMRLGGIPGLSDMAKFAGMHGLKALFAKGLSEAFEESIQEMLDPVFKWIATDEWDGIDADNVIKSGVYGFITAGFLNGVSFITDVASMSMFGDYTAIGHIANKYSGTDLLNQEIVKSIKNDFKILKNSKTELSSLVEDLSQNETVKSAYDSLSDKQKEMINFEDYVSGIAIDATLLVGNNTTVETVNAEAVKKINQELEELNNSKVKIEEAIKANREARNNTKDLAESLKLDDELIELKDQLKSFNGQISILNDLLSGNSLATSLLDPKQVALDLLNDPETAYNIYLTAKLSVEDIANKTDIENRIELEIKDLIKQKSELKAELAKLSSELEKAKTEYQKDVDNDSKYNKYNELSIKYEETVSKIQDKLDTVNKKIEEMSSNEYLQKLISEEISQLKDQEFSLKDKLAEARKELADAKKKYQETKESDIKTRDINYDNMEKASEMVDKLQLDLKNVIYKLNKYIVRSQMLSNIKVIEAETVSNEIKEVSKIDQLIEKYNSIDNNGMSFYIELSSVSDITLEQLSNIKDSEHIKFKINDQIYSYEQIKSMINTNSTLVSKLLSEISSLFNMKEVIDEELISEDENVVSLLEKTKSKISNVYKSIVASISNGYNSAIESLNTKVSESINAIKDLIESIKNNSTTGKENIEQKISEEDIQKKLDRYNELKEKIDLEDFARYLEYSEKGYAQELKQEYDEFERLQRELSSYMDKSSVSENTSEEIIINDDVKLLDTITDSQLSEKLLDHKSTELLLNMTQNEFLEFLSGDLFDTISYVNAQNNETTKSKIEIIKEVLELFSKYATGNYDVKNIIDQIYEFLGSFDVNEILSLAYKIDYQKIRQVLLDDNLYNSLNNANMYDNLDGISKFVYLFDIEKIFSSEIDFSRFIDDYNILKDRFVNLKYPVNQNLKEYLLSKIDDKMTNLEKALTLNYELLKVIEYDQRYVCLDSNYTEKFQELHTDLFTGVNRTDRKIASKVDLENNLAICQDYSVILANLLNSIGIFCSIPNAKLKCRNIINHVSLAVNIDNVTIGFDGVDYSNGSMDLSRVKLGDPMLGINTTNELVKQKINEFVQNHIEEPSLESYKFYKDSSQVTDKISSINNLVGVVNDLQSHNIRELTALLYLEKLRKNKYFGYDTTFKYVSMLVDGNYVRGILVESGDKTFIINTNNMNIVEESKTFVADNINAGNFVFEKFGHLLEYVANVQECLNNALLVGKVGDVSLETVIEEIVENDFEIKISAEMQQVIEAYQKSDNRLTEDVRSNLLNEFKKSQSESSSSIDKSSVSVNVPLLDSGDYDFKEFFKTASHDEIILTIKNNLNNNDFFTQLANYCSSGVIYKGLYWKLFEFDSLVPSLMSNFILVNVTGENLSTNFDEIFDMVLSNIGADEAIEFFNPNIIDDLGPVNRAKLEQRFPGIIDKVLSSPHSASVVVDRLLEKFSDFDNHKYTFSNIPKEQWNAEIIKYLTMGKGLTSMSSSKVIELLKIDELREKLVSSQELCDYLNKNNESIDNQKELFYLLENDVIYSKIDKNSVFLKNYINYNLDNGNFNKLSFSDVLDFYRDTKNSSSEISISSSVENYFINYVSQSDIIDRYKMGTQDFSQTDVQELIDCMGAIADFGISNYEKINVSVDEYNQMFNYINRLLLENSNIIDVEHYQRHIYNFARHFANLNNYFDLKINFFYEENNTNGRHGSNYVSYNGFAFNNEKSSVSIARNLETVFHEIVHEMQARERQIHNNSNTMNKYSLISTIDSIIRSEVDNKYYNDNYVTILDEIDARYNAELLLLNYIKEILPDSSYLINNLVDSLNDNAILYSMNDNYTEYDVLFINRDIVLDKLVKSNLNLLEKYPLLKYIYNENGTRKSIFELIEMRDSISDSNVVSAINYWIKNCNYSLESLATVLYEYECKTINFEGITGEEHAIIGDIKAFKLIETLMSESEYFSDEDFIAKITDVCERIGRENGNMSDADSVKNTLIREYLRYKEYFDENIDFKVRALNNKQFLNYVEKHINDSDVMTDLVMNCTYEQYRHLLNSKLNSKLSKGSKLSETEKVEILKYLVKNKDYFSKIIDNSFSKKFSSLCDEVLSYIPTNELHKHITLEQINNLSLEQKKLFETKFPGVIDKII